MQMRRLVPFVAQVMVSESNETFVSPVFLVQRRKEKETKLVNRVTLVHNQLNLVQLCAKHVMGARSPTPTVQHRAKNVIAVAYLFLPTEAASGAHQVPELPTIHVPDARPLLSLRLVASIAGLVFPVHSL